MKKIFWIKVILILIAVAAVALAAWRILTPAEQPDYKTRAARIKAVEQMVEMCTTDIHDEMAVKDNINGKWIVARQVIEGRIRFDLDSLRMEERGDTTVVYLPPERVDILESASPDAYEVLDAWDGNNRFFPRTLTAAEENTLKKRWENRARQRIYDRGYVKDARQRAVATLTPLLQQMKGPHGEQGPVIIIDPQ